MSTASYALAAGNPEAVEIPQNERGRLKALLFHPEGQGPFPAVVGLHNCTGLTNSAGVAGRALSGLGRTPRQERLRRAVPDSNGSRGIGRQCNVRARWLRTDRERSRSRRPQAWLQSQAWVAADRVWLLGWSSRGIAALWTVRARTPPQGGEDSPDFRSAVALAPGGRHLSNAAWSARAPTLILIGRADDQASTATFQQTVAGARGRSARGGNSCLSRRAPRFRSPEPAAADAHRSCVLGRWRGPCAQRHHPAARADALKRVPAWFER